MKQNNKIGYLIIILVVVVGIIMIDLKGFNFELKYQEAKRIEIVLNKNFEKTEIKQIAKEIFGGQKVLVQKLEIYEDAVTITVKEITDEQKTDFVNKVNEKYGTELKAEDISVIDVSHTRGRDLITPYIWSFVIVTIIILVYMMIRYYKLGSLNVSSKVLVTLIAAELLLFSIVAITRIPVGRATIPLVLCVYILTTLGLTCKFEKELVKGKEQ